MRQISDKKANGVFYTPPHVARYIVANTLDLLPKSSLPRVLDPACGDGVFLQAICDELKQEVWRTARGDLNPPQLLRRSIFGIDRDPVAVDVARSRFTDVAPSLTRANFRVANALDDEAADRASFDAIVGNPPYVNIRLLARTCDEAERRRLRERFECARGAYDLYVLFMERAFELLRPGGVCGMIVPNKIATLDYARPCRELLLSQTTVHHVADVAELSIFRDADVFPYILIWQKQKAGKSHSVSVVTAKTTHDLTDSSRARSVPQSKLSATGFALHGTLDVEDRVPSKPLTDLAKLHSGTAGFTASRVASDLIERTEAGEVDGFDFIVSGNIDPYAVHRGDVRFMKRQFARPVLSVDAGCLTEAKRNLFARPKIVIAGMTKRLEAAFDPGGLALGVQVYAVSDFDEDAFYLLGLLNSKLLSHLFRLRFQAKRLSGGYLAINKGQLAQLPIRTVSTSDPVAKAMRSEIIRHAGKLTNAPIPQDSAATQRIDELVYRLYELTQPEIDRIETVTPQIRSIRRAA